MIPEKLATLIEQQQDDIHRADKKSVEIALEALGVSPDSEFGEIYIKYKPANFESNVSDEYIKDVAEPTQQVLRGTTFIHEVWEIPENYICFTSLQGEGGYFLDKLSGCVWDFDLAQQENFVSGLIPARWGSFFEFLTWYLSPAE
ncbi:SMI1/KNR4 family protein [Pseudomonas sp. N3-W]|uniref:SMI1/KNR4 family protein n=1 Tax=Pseudomonas sp. N3-W TaxID=2975049 RepID=UPI00217D8716|nr:SMI1/KNR4 family protein [Pseudomonas sp. N3-W]UWF51928.1 SMI1/KNR4 family protein [Pseudomonas sp. N3-W]